MPYASIGSISSGTLNSAHLAWAFAVSLNHLAKRDDDPDRKARTNTATAAALDVLAQSEEECEALATFVNETAPDLFESYCAPYSTFGASNGDGSDFGIWPDIEGLMQAATFGDGVIKVNAGDEWPSIPQDIYHVVEVNDHGNVTLYCAQTHEELWSCV